MIRRQGSRLSSSRQGIPAEALSLLHSASLEILKDEDQERERPPLEFAYTFYSDRWKVYYSEEYRDYWYEDTVVGETTWDMPKNILWMRYFSTSGEMWYVNVKTSKFQKKMPVDVELKIVRELQATELTYVRKLRLLVKLISKPLQNLSTSESPIIDANVWRQIFDNTESILSLAETFYEQLTVRGRHAPAPTTPHTLVLEAFAKLVAFFKLYSSYFDHYQSGTKQITDVAASQESFVEFLRIAQAKCADIMEAGKETEDASAAIDTSRKGLAARDRNSDDAHIRRSTTTHPGAARLKIIRSASSPALGRGGRPVSADHVDDSDVLGTEDDCTDAVNFLQSLRILPVQRLPRYVLLLERLLDEDVHLAPDEADKIRDMVIQVRQVAQDCDHIVNQANGWRKMYQVQQSIKDLRFLIMCADRVFKHEGKLVAIGRDLPVRRRSSSIGRRSSLNLVEMVNRRLSLDSGPSGTSHNRTEAASGSADSVGRDQGGVDAFFPDGMWSYRKEREYMVFLFHDILIFCKPTYREKGQQMYEKRGLLTIRRVVDCRREEDPSSWLVFRVYGTIVELHPKLLWTQVCGESGTSRAELGRSDFRDAFDFDELHRLRADALSARTEELRGNAVVQKANVDNLGSITFRAKNAVDKIMWMQKFDDEYHASATATLDSSPDQGDSANPEQQMQRVGGWVRKTESRETAAPDLAEVLGDSESRMSGRTTRADADATFTSKGPPLPQHSWRPYSGDLPPEVYPQRARSPDVDGDGDRRALPSVAIGGIRDTSSSPVGGTRVIRRRLSIGESPRRARSHSNASR